MGVKEAVAAMEVMEAITTMEVVEAIQAKPHGCEKGM